MKRFLNETVKMLYFDSTKRCKYCCTPIHITRSYLTADQSFFTLIKIALVVLNESCNVGLATHAPDVLKVLQALLPSRQTIFKR